MKKLAIIPLFSALAGCISMPQTPDAEKYLTVQPESPPPEYRGLWTGAMGPYISTMEISADGRGNLCSDWSGANSVTGVKYADGQIHTVGFGAADASISNNVLTIDPVDAAYPTYTFRSDNDLVEAANFCAEKLNPK